jgi:hypothetical protein
VIYVKPAITVMELIQLHKLSVLKAIIVLMVLSMQINTLAQLEVTVLQQVLLLNLDALNALVAISVNLLAKLLNLLKF